MNGEALVEVGSVIWIVPTVATTWLNVNEPYTGVAFSATKDTVVELDS